jgi:hypothetical protein
MKSLKGILLSSVLSIALFTSCASEKAATEPTPPTVVEKVSPGPTYVIRGPEWRWDRTKKVYVYVPGEYVDKQGGVWVRGHWKPVKGGVKWVPGYWK